MGRQLTPRQAAFIREYLVDLNATQAAIRAGYSARTARAQGHRLLTDADIRQAITEAQEQRSERTGITADYVLSNIKEVAERCMQRAPVMVRGKGGQWVQATDEEGRHVWRFDSRGAVAALDLLGRHLKLFTDKIEHSGDVMIRVVDPYAQQSGGEEGEA